MTTFRILQATNQKVEQKFPATLANVSGERQSFASSQRWSTRQAYGDNGTRARVRHIRQ